MQLGILKVKSVEQKISHAQLDQPYKVVLFVEVREKNGKIVETGLQAERAFFPRWIKFKAGMIDGHYKLKEEEFRPDVLYSDVLPGNLVEGSIVSFTVLFEDERTQQLNVVILSENEDPQQRVLKWINEFPCTLVDADGNKLHLPSVVNC